MLKMDLEYKGGILFIRLIGTLNRKTTYKIYNYIIPVINKHHIKYVIYNFKDMKDIDNYGIDSIISTKIAMKKNNGKLLLCNINKFLNDKIKKLRIPIINTERGAIKIVRGG